MNQKIVRKTQNEFRIPNKWHNHKEGFITLQELYNLGKHSETLILNLNSTVYISFIVFGYLRQCIDRLKIMFNTEVVFYINENFTNDISCLESLVYPNDEERIHLFFNCYSILEEEKFKKDVSDQINFIEERIFAKQVQTNIYELFINAQKHSGDISKMGDYSIYFGICITKKKLRIIVANNGDFFSKGIIEKCNIRYDQEYEYIRKSLELGFSTKKDFNGGVGLHLIEEFAKSYSAKLEIISGKGFLHYDNHREKILNKEINLQSDYSEDFINPLPGSLVYLEIDVKSIKHSIEPNEKQKNFIDDIYS